MGYHLFSANLGQDDWIKTAQVMDDTEFYRTVDLIGGYVPFNMSAYHFDSPEMLYKNPVISRRAVIEVPVCTLFQTQPEQPMKLKDKCRGRTLPIVRKVGDYVLTKSEYGERFWRVDGQATSIITELHSVPITLREAAAYVDAHHRHNAGPKFHKFSVALKVFGEPEPVGVVIPCPAPARAGRSQQTSGYALFSMTFWSGFPVGAAAIKTCGSWKTSTYTAPIIGSS